MRIGCAFLDAHLMRIFRCASDAHVLQTGGSVKNAKKSDAHLGYCLYNVLQESAPAAQNCALHLERTILYDIKRNK